MSTVTTVASKAYIAEATSRTKNTDPRDRQPRQLRHLVHARGQARHDIFRFIIFFEKYQHALPQAATGWTGKIAMMQFYTDPRLASLQYSAVVH
jgi:hypothetical protein